MNKSMQVKNYEHLELLSEKHRSYGAEHFGKLMIIKAECMLFGSETAAWILYVNDKSC
jgi:hypothetical protein